MKHFILSFTVLFSAAPLAVSAVDLPKTPGSQLETGVYELSSDLTISASEAGQSALIIGENQTVTLYLKKNATLTLTGGAANGTAGAGAGILLPETSSLYVTGEGTIVAAGGNAANGGNAEKGSDAKVTNSEKCEIDNTTHSLDGGSFVNGGGGAGGNGGGGAGAGIGGKGGNGGAGGAGGTSRVRYDHPKQFHTNGNDGGNGGNGANGGSAGKFYVLGSVIVKATGGNAGANGTTAAYGKHHVKIQGDDWLAAGGAPGGAGQGGAAAEAIGFGGRGGAGGGGGGSGGFFQFDNIKDNTGSDGNKEDSRFRPGCGRNGWEGASAEVYTAEEYNCYDGSAKLPNAARSGFGGKAGAIARNGNPGELHATPTTSLTLSPAKPVEQLANVEPNLSVITLTFKDGETVVGTKEVALGAAFPAPPTCSKHEGEVFTGWYMDGRCCYDAAGIALLSASPLMENVTLEAKWIPDSSILEVTDLATLKKAIQALAADATLVDKAGQRRVTIKDNINLSENLIIPASVGKLQLLGPATISSDSAVEISAEGAQVYAENLTLKNLDVKAQKLTLFNVAISGENSNTIKASPLLASSTTMESVKMDGRGLLVNTTIRGVAVEDGADYRFVNVTSIGDMEIAEERFINSLSVDDADLNEITLLGVTHKYFEPTAAALDSAVEIYYEPTGENIAKMVNGEKVAIIGHAALATRCLTLDQLGNVRKTPTKGAIRLISEQPTLAIEAKTEEGQYVAETISVDYAATSVNIPGGNENAEVVTTPYALVAATVDALISETDININGEAVVAMAKASGIAANNLVVNGDSFSANSLDQMSSITLEDAALEGGELQWFGSSNLVKADLNAKTFSGGSDFKKTDPLTVAAKGSRTETLASVTSDALAQIAITTTAKAGVKLKVVSSGYEWTDSTPVGSSGKTVTKIYTIPLKAGEYPKVVVTNGSGAGITFTLSAQYIYFGVEE